LPRRLEPVLTYGRNFSLWRGDSGVPTKSFAPRNSAGDYRDQPDRTTNAATREDKPGIEADIPAWPPFGDALHPRPGSSCCRPWLIVGDRRNGHVLPGRRIFVRVFFPASPHAGYSQACAADDMPRQALTIIPRAAGTSMTKLLRPVSIFTKPNDSAAFPRLTPNILGEARPFLRMF